MFLIVTRNFPPDIGGMQMLMGGLSETLVNHGPVKVFAYECQNSSTYDTKTSININCQIYKQKKVKNNRFKAESSIFMKKKFLPLSKKTSW